jgi:AraC-like DNA-binding protein
LVLACNILDRTPLGEALPRALLQSETRLSISQLNRLCRKERGCCLREYRERIRLERACSALEDSSQSVKEIAYDLGFKQLSHFSIWFKKHRAKSPRSFRASVTDHQ